MIITIKSIAFFIYGLLIFTFSSYLKFANLFDKYFNWSHNDMEDSLIYDYIVVGAGSAGSVIATRLSEAGENTLLLEAGGNPPPFSNIPILAPLFQRSVYDWQYITAPQKYACKGLKGNQSLWPTGKILGGSSRLNYMAYVIGHKKDYVDWFEDFEEYSNEKLDTSKVNYADWYTDLSKAVLAGVEELGEFVGDINAHLNTGFTRVQLTSNKGERWSADRMLNKKMEKLYIITDALVNKVLFTAGSKAEGIEYLKLGTRLKAFANKGVIISAGAIGSPKLLMLSGIGPKNHLNDLKIEVINDLPVGKNLMDHILTGIDLVILNKTLPLNILNLLNPVSAFDYYINGKGPWTSSAIEIVGTTYGASSRAKLSYENNHPPDLQFMVMPVGISQDGGIALRKILGIRDEIFEDYYSPLIDKTAVSILPVLLHPKSSGEIKLRSNDPNDHPIIDPNYLSVKEDVDVLIDGIQFVKKLLNTETMKKIGAKIYQKHYPMCKKYLFDTNEYWECYVRHVTLTSYHPAGTCRIGSVVDKYFRVYDTENLYVVDASIFPSLPSGNINAAVLMSAEKAAKLLIDDKFNINNNYLDKILICDRNDFIKYLFH